MPSQILFHVSGRDDQYVVRKVRIWNFAIHPVRLSVQPMCGCTKTSWVQDEIGPLSSDVIELQLDAASFRQPKKVDVTFKTNWKSQPFASIHVQSL